MTTIEPGKILKALKNLSKVVTICVNAIDAEMNKPASGMRGSRIAKICNALEMENEKVRYFSLGENYRKKKK